MPSPLPPTYTDSELLIEPSVAVALLVCPAAFSVTPDDDRPAVGPQPPKPGGSASGEADGPAL